MDGRIFYLRERIVENLQHDWTVEELSRAIGISAPYLQRLFKSALGIPPITYLRDLRLEKARELLESENPFYQVSEICSKVGMFSSSHFTRDFKRKFGMTPTEYRKHHWEKLQAAAGAGQDERRG